MEEQATDISEEESKFIGTPPQYAVLDADIIAYRAAFWADQEGFEWLESRIDDDVKRWTPPTIGAVKLALSCRRKDNFRKDSFPAYKEHRTYRPDPECLSDAIAYIKDNFDVLMQDRLEADDLIGMHQSSYKAVGVTIDKDLCQIPGYWWKPPVNPEDFPSETISYRTKQEADYFFHRQWITGDSTDNIPGIWKLGPKKAEVLLNQTKSQNHTPLVFMLYETRPNKEGGNYTRDDAVAMAKAVRILRDGECTHWEP